jgi:glycerol-3-phosphate dehydrogenase (NAD(P)+)
MNITVLSDGGWGTALALLLCENNHNVRLWGPFEDYVSEMREKKENVRFLPGISLPDDLTLCSDMREAVDDAEIVVLASPSQYMRSTLEKFKPFYKGQILVNVAKGIEVGTLKRMSQLCEEILDDCKYIVLSGPSHAEEVALKRPTAVVAASNNIETAEIAQEAFMNKYFRVYTTNDVVSVELGGALKNVMAIAAGIIDGMGIGDNPKAALITRGIAEMSRLGLNLGGNAKTFSGLSGTGDLIVTCMSGHSRNRHVGEELGREKKLDEILSEMGLSVAEGVKTAESAHELASRNNVETPIINEIYSILYEDKSPKEAVHDLMTRKARSEFD